MSAPRTEPPVNALVAFLAVLLLVVPTHGALGATSDGSLWAWFTGGIAAVAALGALLGVLVPQALALVLLAASGYVAAALAGVFVVATAGDPPGNGTVALLVGVPAAAIGGLLAAVVVGRTEDGALPVAGVAVLLVGLTGVSLAPTAGSALDDARDEADDVARMEASGLSAYLPDIADLEPTSWSTLSRDGQVVGYSLSYHLPTDEIADAFLAVDVSREVAYEDCGAPPPGLYDCRDEDGYVVFSRDGDPDAVVADLGGTYLEATYYGSEGLPDPDEVGRALADAEVVEWRDVVRVD